LVRVPGSGERGLEVALDGVGGLDFIAEQHRNVAAAVDALGTGGVFGDAEGDRVGAHVLLSVAGDERQHTEQSNAKETGDVHGTATILSPIATQACIAGRSMSPEKVTTLLISVFSCV